jgi:hypothetical protein
MPSISVDFLKPGMVLARDVRGNNGIVLLGAGAEITERHVQIFKSWGVADVEVKGPDQEALNTRMLSRLDAASRERIDQELDRLFAHNDPYDPVIEELRRICLARESLRAVGAS